MAVSMMPTLVMGKCPWGEIGAPQGGCSLRLTNPSVRGEGPRFARARQRTHVVECARKKTMLDVKMRRKALEQLRQLQRDLESASDEELTQALGDSPDELDLAPVRKGARARRGSALTRTA